MKRELKEFQIKAQFNGDIEKYYLNGQLYTGIIYEELGNHIVSEFEIKDGVKHGTEAVFDENGGIQETWTFKNGREDGSAKEYSETGKLLHEQFFEKGICLWSKSYDESGQVTAQYEIDKKSPEYIVLENWRKKEAASV